MKKSGEAIDQIRRMEIAQPKASGKENMIVIGRWALLKRPENLTEKQAGRLDDLLNVPFGDQKSLAFRRREETCILVACGDIAMARTQKQI
jgi:hypothetical protein